MKRILFAAAVFAGVFSAFAAGELRLDLRKIKDTTFGEITVSEGLKIAVQDPKGAKDGITKALIYSEKLTDEWKKFTVTFVPEDDGRIALSFHTVGSGKLDSIKPLLIDDVRVVGGKIANGGFETLKNGAPASWRMGRHKENEAYSAKLVTGKAAEGENCVQVFYNSGVVSQAIRVTADEKVTLTFQARLAE